MRTLLFLTLIALATALDIHVKAPSGRNLLLHVDPEDHLGRIRETVAEAEDIDPSQISLHYNDHELHDDHMSLDDYGLEHDCYVSAHLKKEECHQGGHKDGHSDHLCHEKCEKDFCRGPRGKPGRDGRDGRDGSTCVLVAAPAGSCPAGGGSLLVCTTPGIPTGTVTLICNGTSPNVTVTSIPVGDPRCSTAGGINVTINGVSNIICNGTTSNVTVTPIPTGVIICNGAGGVNLTVNGVSSIICNGVTSNITAVPSTTPGCVDLYSTGVFVPIYLTTLCNGTITAVASVFPPGDPICSAAGCANGCTANIFPNGTIGLVSCEVSNCTATILPPTDSLCTLGGCGFGCAAEVCNGTITFAACLTDNCVVNLLPPTDGACVVAGCAYGCETRTCSGILAATSCEASPGNCSCIECPTTVLVAGNPVCGTCTGGCVVNLCPNGTVSGPVACVNATTPACTVSVITSALICGGFGVTCPSGCIVQNCTGTITAVCAAPTGAIVDRTLLTFASGFAALTATDSTVSFPVQVLTPGDFLYLGDGASYILPNTTGGPANNLNDDVFVSFGKTIASDSEIVRFACSFAGSNRNVGVNTTIVTPIVYTFTLYELIPTGLNLGLALPNATATDATPTLIATCVVTIPAGTTTGPAVYTGSSSFPLSSGVLSGAVLDVVVTSNSGFPFTLSPTAGVSASVEVQWPTP